MPNIKVEPTIPNYPPQGIQAQLDLLYLWNPDVANDLIDQINKALEEVGKDLDNYLTKAEAAATYATITTVDGKQDALTAEQLAAVNSGITAEHVTTYDAYAAEISQAQADATKAENAAEVAQQTANLAGQEAAQALTQLAGKQATLTDPQLNAVNSGVTAAKVASYDAYAGEISAKVNIAQGAENAGKVMTVSADGNLAPADVPSSSLPDQFGNAEKFLFTTGTELVWKYAISEDEAGTIAQDKVLWFGNSAAGIGTSDDNFGLYYYGNMLLGFDATGTCFIPMNGFQDLGDSGSKFNCVYTTQLNNGADIAIPTTGGTMALLSDIPDISNLATKTEVQQEIQDAIGTIETALAEV